MSDAYANGPKLTNATAADWVVCFAGAMGALLVSLDLSIVNSSLPQIQGEIGANGTEATWISTGYLISEVVIIPLTAWLTRVFGLRTLLVTCATGFVLFSMLCGLSESLAVMVIGRIGQGFVGGCLIPTAQTIIRTRLPQRQLAQGMTVFSLIILVGPLIGPNLGGYLTENVSWRWCFFINLPVGVAIVTLLLLGLDYTPPRFDLLRNADWGGILGMTIGLSSITCVLEEGQRERWFDSNLICWLTVASIAGFVIFAIAQRLTRHPVINLRLLMIPSYSGVIIIVLTVGMVMYSVLYVLPQFLGTISGYNALQSGQVMFFSGIPAMALSPLLPRIINKVDVRLLVISGIVASGAASFLTVHLTSLSTGSIFVVPQLLRGVGQVFCNFPLSQASVSAVPFEDTADAAGIYNMARNLGGSIGLASLGVFIDRRTEAHADHIREAVQANSPLVQDRIAQSTASFMQQSTDPAHAHMQALASLAGQIHREAMVMTYSDCFYLLGVAMFVCIPLALLLRQPKNRFVDDIAH